MQVLTCSSDFGRYHNVVSDIHLPRRSDQYSIHTATGVNRPVWIIQAVKENMRSRHEHCVFLSTYIYRCEFKCTAILTIVNLDLPAAHWQARLLGTVAEHRQRIQFWLRIPLHCDKSGLIVMHSGENSYGTQSINNVVAVHFDAPRHASLDYDVQRWKWLEKPRMR